MTARIPAAIVPALRALLSGRPADWPELAPEAWERVTAALDDQGALPLVHAAIRDVAAADVEGRSKSALPEPLLQAAAAAYYGVAARNALLLVERDAVLTRLADHGIYAVPLKGAALLGTAYANIALRPLGDLDVLVGERDVARTDALLAADGYARELSGIPELRHHLEYVRVLPGGLRLSLEVHRRVLASPALEAALPAAAVLTRAAPDPLAGGPAIPSPPDLLLHAAAHLVIQHARQERLIWVADIDRIVRRWFVPGGPAEASAALGWHTALEAAEAAGLAAVLADALAAAVLWFDTPRLPAANAVLDAGGRRAGSASLARLRGHAPVGREGARVLGDARALPTWRARATYALRSAFPSPAYMRAWYGVDRPALLPIYYAARLGRGLWHIAAHAARPAGERRRAAEPPDRWMVDG